MSNYIVSARKYRPMRFDEVVGQNHVSKTLKNALKTDHLGHSFLFCGPRGVGKTTSARILAKVLNCENRTEDFEPCNQCSSCTAFNQNQSFNIYELDAASNNSVENIRDLVDQVRFPPQQGQYKVYIIDEVHMLSQAAFNAFLKTLEEPPHYAIFILATTEKHKIIPTILSRCQIFDFNRVQVADIVNHLKMICQQEGITAEESGLHVIAQKADGALRDALSIFDRIISFSGNEVTYQQVTESLNLLDYDTFFELTNSLLLQDKNSVLLQFDQILTNGFDGDQVMLGLAEHFRNLLVAKNPATLSLLEVAPDVLERFQEQAQFAKTSFLLNALNISNDCDVKFKQAKNKRLHVELALLKICYLGQTEKNVELPTSNDAQVVKKNDNLESKPVSHSNKETENQEPRQEQPKEPIIPEEQLLTNDEERAPINEVAPIPKVEESQPIVEEVEVQPQITEEQPQEIEEETSFKPLEVEPTVVEEPVTEINQPQVQETYTELKEEGTGETEDIQPETPTTTVSETTEEITKQNLATTNKASKKGIKPALSFRLSELNAEVEKRKQRAASTQNAENGEEEAADFSENPEVSEEEVKQAWYSLSDKVKSSSLARGIQDSSVTYKDNKLIVTVQGKVIRDFLKEHHNLIVETIQKGTGLKRFIFEIEWTEVDVQNQKTFTKEEQLQYIKEQNPAVKKLCDDFDLQISYD